MIGAQKSNQPALLAGNIAFDVVDLGTLERVPLFLFWLLRKVAAKADGDAQ